MADIAALKIELDTDPLTRGYAGMTDAQAADSLNTADRTRIKSIMTGDELFINTDSTEFAALADTKKSEWLSFTSKDVDPSNATNVAFVQYVFGGGSTTISNLNTSRTESISRAEELGLGSVREGTVASARAL